MGKYTIKTYKLHNEEKTFKIFDIEYAKANLFPKPNKLTIADLIHRLELCGYENVQFVKEYKKLNGSRFSAKCTNINCTNTGEKQYNHCMQGQPIYCKDCGMFVREAKKFMQGKRSLLDVRPDLAKHYRPEDNDGKSMNEISAGSKKHKIRFRCADCGLIQADEDMIDANNCTTNRGGNFISGFYCKHCHSLAEKFPEIALEWDYDKNEKTPADYSPSSSFIAHWKCNEGHEREASIAARTANGSGCGQCSMSRGEKAMSVFLKELNINFQSEYRAVIEGHYRYFDFYLPEFNLFIEVHGKQHFEKVDHFNSDEMKQRAIDKQKQKYAEKNGHYIMVDYREHNPELAIERFANQFIEFLENVA